MKLIWLVLQSALLSTFLYVSLAEARLGGDLSSINDDHAKLHGRFHSFVDQSQVPRHHKIISGNYTVREYISQSGHVYAVSWRGQSMPDLSILFGQNQYNNFLDAKAKQDAAVTNPVAHARRRGVKITRCDEAGIVVERGGWMSDVYGRAYIEKQIPPEVNLQDVQ